LGPAWVGTGGLVAIKFGVSSQGRGGGGMGVKRSGCVGSLSFPTVAKQAVV